MTDKKEFIFRHTNNKNWKAIHSNLDNNIDDFIKQYSKDFVVTIAKYSPKRSDKQLRSYWMLINSARRYMNSQGNNFTQEEFSDFFKIRAGHCKYLDHTQIPKSISNRSSTTADEMQTLITVILEFGQEYNIKDCYIEDQELKELLTYYER